MSESVFRRGISADASDDRAAKVFIQIGFAMTRLSTCSFICATLIGNFIVADIAEAQKPRNPVERRLRPGQGFWDNSTSRSSRSVSSSMFRSTPAYTAPRTYAPAQAYTPPTEPLTRLSPSTVQPSSAVVQRGYTVPSNVVTSPRVIYRSPVVTSQPRIISERVIAINGVPVNSQPALARLPNGTVIRR